MNLHKLRELVPVHLQIGTHPVGTSLDSPLPATCVCSNACWNFDSLQTNHDCSCWPTSKININLFNVLESSRLALLSWQLLEFQFWIEQVVLELWTNLVHRILWLFVWIPLDWSLNIQYNSIILDAMCERFLFTSWKDLNSNKTIIEETFNELIRNNSTWWG